MLKLESGVREELWRRLVDAVERHAEEVTSLPVAPPLDPVKIRALLAPFDFERPVEPIEAVERVVAGLREHQVHTTHPRYFGLFNPAPTTMGIAADALVAAFNPQLAAWSHSPFANEVERHLVRAFGGKFGYDPARTDGTFASGGAEANHTALLTALVHAFPDFARKGLRALPAQPVFYVSPESHHSFLKAARLTGLGTDAVREIETDDRLRMNPAALAERIARDEAEGHKPFMIVATVGTTNSGIIDPVAELADIAARRGMWLHADAAWGGAAVLVPELRGLLHGIERADSITFDAHKWLSVPMGAGLYLTRHEEIVDRTFRVANSYMPRESRELNTTDPYAHSMQWSRRFTGLKVFLSLAVAGWEGYIETIRHQVKMGDLMRRELENSGWKIVNRTPLPVVCFVDGADAEGESAGYLEAIARAAVATGETWISTTRLDGGGRPVLRACVTNYLTGDEDVKALAKILDEARRRVRS